MSLPTSATSVAAAAITMVLALATFFWLTLGEAASAGAGGVLDVDGAQYQFTPSACAVADADFVVAGKGKADGESFWVSASSRGISLSVGTASELERPTEDQLWLTSVGAVEWAGHDDGTLEVAATMHDGHTGAGSPAPATLAVTCDPTG